MIVVLATDLIVFLIFFVILFFALKAKTSEDMKSLIKTVKANPLAMIATFVLSLYLVIALADSIRWRDKIMDTNGEIQTTAEGTIIYDPRPLSILDRLFTNIRINNEKTYSSPMAKKHFVKEQIEKDGEKMRGYSDLQYPSSHVLGTDKVGSDVFFQSLKGVRTAIVIGTGATIVVIPLALFFGIIAGFMKGIFDDIIQYIYTTLASIPDILLIVSFMLILGTRGFQGGVVTDEMLTWNFFILNDRLFWLCLILGITSWTGLCRLIRGETMKISELNYIEAATSFGLSKSKIMWRHIMPNVMHLVVITFVLRFSGLVLAEAVLSYIGIGVGAETGSFGNMINSARLELSREPIVWWNLFAAFVFMFTLVLAANIFGDAVRDGLDPKLKKK